MVEQNLILIILFVFTCLVNNVNAEQPVIFDIRTYGAKPGADISEALLSAWKHACASPKASKIFIAPGQWGLSKARLLGPNKAPLELEVQGIVEAYSDIPQLPDDQWEWISINYVDRFTLSGRGVFDGNGRKAWRSNDCMKTENCIRLPVNLGFNFMNNSIIHGLTSKDSKSAHIKCLECLNVTFARFTISAPGNSPNTDGIHLARSSSIRVTNSIIKTGDDCISMGDGLKQVHIEHVTCGPGHGISIGSLGRSLSEQDVSGIYVTNCTFIRTQNGVRVKTWPSGPATLRISDVHFENLIMVSVSNPIIIDQQYCPHKFCSRGKASLVQISKVSIKNIRGTTNSAKAITFSCSSSKPCENVEVGDIDLKYIGNYGKYGKHGHITSNCANIRLTSVGKQNLRLCA